MKLVVLAPHFAPDIAPTGEVVTRVVEELARRGHTIEVVTALPGTGATRSSPITPAVSIGTRTLRGDASRGSTRSPARTNAICYVAQRVTSGLARWPR